MSVKQSQLRVKLVNIKNLAEAHERLALTGSDSRGIDIMARKCIQLCISLEDVPIRAAILLKQEMLAKGGDCAVSRNVAALACEASDILLMGTLRQLEQVVESLSRQPFGLKAIGLEIARVLDAQTAKPPPSGVVVPWSGGVNDLGFGVHPEFHSDDIELPTLAAALLRTPNHPVWLRGTTCRVIPLIERLAEACSHPPSVIIEGAGTEDREELHEAMKRWPAAPFRTALSEDAALKALESGVPPSAICVAVNASGALQSTHEAVLGARGLGLQVVARVHYEPSGACVAAASGAAALAAGAWIVFMEDTEAGLGLHRSLQLNN